MASYVEIIRLFLSSQTLDFRKNTPAYAGNTSDPSSTIPVFRDRPRLRGEYGRLPVPLIVPVGSPPLARGIQSVMLEPSPPRRITPACAGNTHGRRLDVLVKGDHPRLRGEYIPVLAPPPPAKGSPPLARGIPPIDPYRTKGGRITPACAGNTRLPERIEPGFWDHPRLRGEYKDLKLDKEQTRGSPPLARGILRLLYSVKSTSGITPACAGNTVE